MCNTKNLKTNLSMIGQAAKRQLNLPLVFPPGVTAETSNMQVPEAVYPRRDGLVLRPVDPADPAAGLEPFIAHWNLTPAYHKGPLKGWKAAMNNARSETMMSPKSAFRQACERRRAIVPATSFTEWTGPKGKKTAHQISRADGGLHFFAGLWERCWPEGEPVDTYTLVMMEAVEGDDVYPFHTRQPVTLDARSAAIWLDLTADFQSVLKAPPPGTLVADPPEPIAA